MAIDAVLLAGRENRGALRGASDAPWEALVQFGGRPMAAWVAEAALGAAGVGRLAVVGPAAIGSDVAAFGSDRVVTLCPHGSMLENLQRGIAACGGASEMVLILTSDIPLVRSVMVERFLRQALSRQPVADFYYPVVSKQVVESRFGKSQRTYVRLREGTFTGGNLALVRPQVLIKMAHEVETFMALRKSPFKLAKRLGWGFLIHFLLSRPTLAQVEQHFSELFGVRGQAVVVDDAEIGVDVDKPEDLALCEAVLAHG
ncbi:MAG: nucleotidyltransferase family protein [Sulfobacillus sp.]